MKKKIIIKADNVLTCEDKEVVSDLVSLIRDAVKASESFDLKFVQQVILKHNGMTVKVKNKP